MRVLTFPTAQVVGTFRWNSSWDRNRGPVFATSEVSVPDDEKISFAGLLVESVGGHANGSWSFSGGLRPLDLSFLGDLPDDAFFVVTLTRPLLERSMELLPHLARGLHQLTLSNAQLHDESLSHVAQLDALTSLRTFGNNFTDVGIQRLVALRDLKQLWLEEESLSGEQFDFAAHLPRLLRLGLRDGPIAAEELTRLRALRPDAEVG